MFGSIGITELIILGLVLVLPLAVWLIYRRSKSSLNANRALRNLYIPSANSASLRVDDRNDYDYEHDYDNDDELEHEHEEERRLSLFQ